jgi:ankyrin repeat protein
MAMSSSKLLNSVALLLRIVESQDWQSFQILTLSSSATFRALCEDIAGCKEFYGMTLLHAAARYDPPLTVVAKMIEICPELTSATDCVGRTPLHVAAGMGASPALIKLIAHACPAACDAQDEDGKTPLHFACDSSCQLFEDDALIKPTSRATPNHDSIRALLSLSLHAATIEDMDDMNPLEYAIMSNASLKTIKLLQRASAVTLSESQSWSRSKSPNTGLPVSVIACK